MASLSFFLAWYKPVGRGWSRVCTLFAPDDAAAETTVREQVNGVAVDKVRVKWQPVSEAGVFGHRVAVDGVLFEHLSLDIPPPAIALDQPRDD